MNQEMKQAFEGIKTHIDTQISHLREDVSGIKKDVGSLETRMTTKMVELADFIMESLENTKIELRSEMSDMKTELKSEFKKDLLDTKIELKKDIADSAFEIRKSTSSQHDFSLLTKRVEVLEKV